MPGLLVVAVLAGLILYAPALNHPYIADDHEIVETNPLLRNSGIAVIPRLFTLDYWQSLDRNGQPYRLASDRNLYRPFTMVTFWLNARLTGVTPAGLRFGNVLLHALAAASIGVLCFRLTRSGIAAALVMLFAAVHPLGTDVVNRLTGRSDILVALLGTLTLIALHRPAGKQRGRIAAGVAGLAAFLAMASKESGLAIVPVTILWIFIQRDEEGSGLRGKLPDLIAVSAAFVLYVVLRQPAIGDAPGTIAAGESDLTGNPLAGQSFTARLPAALSLAWYYARMAVWPFPLRVFDRPAVLPSWTSVDVWLGVLVIAALAILALRSFRRTPASLLATAGWFAGYALVSQIAAPIGTFREARLAYPLLPAAGLGLAVLLSQSAGSRFDRALKGTMIGLAVVFGILCLQRNHDFASELILFQREAAENPESPLAHLILGGIHVAGNPQAAKSEFETAVRLAPESSQALTDLGSLNAQLGDTAQAEVILHRAVALNPTNSRALMSFGVLRLQQQRLEEAYDYLKRSEALNPGPVMTQMNLALVEALRGDGPAALARVASIEPRAAGNPNVAALRRFIQGRMEIPGAADR